MTLGFILFTLAVIGVVLFIVFGVVRFRRSLRNLETTTREHYERMSIDRRR